MQTLRLLLFDTIMFNDCKQAMPINLSNLSRGINFLSHKRKLTTYAFCIVLLHSHGMVQCYSKIYGVNLNISDTSEIQRTDYLLIYLRGL